MEQQQLYFLFLIAPSETVFLNDLALYLKDLEFLSLAITALKLFAPSF